MPFADANGQKLYYTDSGGDGPAVLLSHGFLMGHDMWNHQVTALQDGYRVIAYDERGWGQSEFTSPFTFWDMADDAIALLDHLGIAQAVLGGMSQGGFLTLRAALRYPDRVRGMILIDTQARAWVEEEITGFTGLLDTVLAGGWNDELVAMFYGLLFGPGFDDPYWSGKWRSRPPETVIPAWECLRDRDDVTDRLGEIACPALIVHGEVDAGIAIEDGRVLEDKLPNVVGFCAVPGAGHTPNVERPDIVNPAIRSFLDELS